MKLFNHIQSNSLNCKNNYEKYYFLKWYYDLWTISRFCYPVLSLLYQLHRPNYDYFFKCYDEDPSSPEIQKDEKDTDSVRPRQGPVHGLASQRRGQGNLWGGGCYLGDFKLIWFIVRTIKLKSMKILNVQALNLWTFQTNLVKW